MKVVVLGGGSSPEREVSIRSAKAVANAARQAGYEVIELDPAHGLQALDGLGGDVVVLPILHGAGGEDGVLQAELEKRGLAYLGSDSESSANSFDKWKTRQILQQNHIPVAKGQLVNRQTYITCPLTSGPHVLKIDHGGSSIGTLIARDPSLLEPSQIDNIFAMEDQAVVEELVEGIEVTVPILDQTALPPIEVKPPEGGEFDYENKYNGKSAELCPPPSLNSEQIKQSQLLAEQVHKAMGCRHLSRVDTIMRPDGSFVVLEINTIPGLTDQSLYPKAASVTGIDMPELVKKFVELARRDFGTGAAGKNHR